VPAELLCSDAINNVAPVLGNAGTNHLVEIPQNSSLHLSASERAREAPDLIFDCGTREEKVERLLYGRIAPNLVRPVGKMFSTEHAQQSAQLNSTIGA
jgi:hypothetical protein